MKYLDGQDARIGDIVEVGDDTRGTVVVLVEEGLAAEGFAPDEWSYLKGGVLIETDHMGLVHYPEKFNEHLLLASRGTQQSPSKSS